MLDTRFLRASDGTGPAPIARINTARIAGATVYKVDTVNKWPPQAFIATVGTLNVNGYLDPTLAPINQFRGHITGSDIIIDSWEPGSAFAVTDLGNAVNQYIILKQTTGTENLIQDAIAELQNEDTLRATHTTFDFVLSGGFWSFTAATLNGAMTALIAYQAGLRGTAALIATRAFTANKDTYIDALRGGTIYAPTFSIVYTEVVNGAASPALAANSIRLAKVISGATAITSIVQSRNDSLGVAIRPVAPIRASGVMADVKFYASETNGQLVGSSTVIVFNALDYNTGGAYNPATGIFTAPFDGTYHFDTNVQYSGLATQPVIPQWFKNSVPFARFARNDSASNNYACAGGIDLYLLAGETASVVAGVTGTSRNLEATWSYFCGRMVSRN